MFYVDALSLSELNRPFVDLPSRTVTAGGFRYEMLYIYIYIKHEKASENIIHIWNKHSKFGLTRIFLKISQPPGPPAQRYLKQGAWSLDGPGCGPPWASERRFRKRNVRDWLPYYCSFHRIVHSHPFLKAWCICVGVYSQTISVVLSRYRFNAGIFE